MSTHSAAEPIATEISSLHVSRSLVTLFFFFFNDTATTEIYTLSLHDALPIYRWSRVIGHLRCMRELRQPRHSDPRSEEHTSELQSPYDLVCRLLLEKKKKITTTLNNSLITSQPRNLTGLNQLTSHYLFSYS